MFALDHLSEKPDIICLAKSLTGGYIPLAATIFNEEIHREFVDSNLKRLFYMVTLLLPIQWVAQQLWHLNLFAKDKTFKI